MDFLRSMRKPKNKKKAGSKEKVKKEPSVRNTDKKKSSRSGRNKVKRKPRVVGAKAIDWRKDEPTEIFDKATFSFKIDKTVDPEPANHQSYQKVAFESFAMTLMGIGVEGLAKEYFESLVTFIPTGFFDRVIFDANHEMKKNRYKDVICNDRTRVILRDGRPGDYIHANYVRGARPTSILTQGPTRESLVDFWRLVVQENVTAVCMLCELVENGRPKCEVYFPEPAGETMPIGGEFVVVCTDSMQPDAHTQLRVLVVTDKRTGKSLQVNHYKLVTWPDKTVAVSNLSVLRTHRILRKLAGSVVIHCSAGVGRTGTFAAIELGIQLILNGKAFKTCELVKAIRHCRLFSVQMDTQYLMLAEAILDCGVSYKYIDDAKLLEQIEAFKRQVAEYVEAHPPPPEKPMGAAVLRGSAEAMTPSPAGQPAGQPAQPATPSPAAVPAFPPASEPGV